MKEKLNYLEKNRVFIHTDYEYYNEETNMLFSIEFGNYAKYNAQTGWFNDNHEFGDTGTALESAINLAYWYLEDDERIKNINGNFNHPTHIERSAKLLEYYTGD